MSVNTRSRDPVSLARFDQRLLLGAMAICSVGSCVLSCLRSGERLRGSGRSRGIMLDEKTAIGETHLQRCETIYDVLRDNDTEMADGALLLCLDHALKDDGRDDCSVDIR